MQTPSPFADRANSAPPADPAARVPLPLRELEAYAYRFPLWQDGGDREDCADFLLMVRAELPRIIERYTDQGRPFLGYLRVCLTWQWRTFCRRRTAARRERAAAVTVGRVMAVTDDHTERAAEWSARRIEHDTTRRRIVAAAVKAACDLDDSQVAVIAQSTGRADLPALIERARSIVDTARADSLRRRMVANLGRRVVGHTERAVPYENAARELRAVRRGPSNRQVAEILGIPKGTVDTYLHHLKRTGAGGGCMKVAGDPRVNQAARRVPIEQRGTRRRGHGGGIPWPWRASSTTPAGCAPSRR